MSDAAVRWARGFPVDSARARAVLVALAELCDEKHCCAVGQVEIAERTKQGERNVRRYLQALEAAGAITRKVQQRVEGRGREPDLYVLAVDVLAAAPNPRPTGHQPDKTLDQPATNRTNDTNSGYALRDLNNKQTPPTPPTSAAGRWQHAQRLDALPGPMVCDDFETARNHPECRRVAGLVVDAASRQAEFRLTPSERKKAWGAALELLQVGHAPEAIAAAIANAPTRTFPSITLELNRARSAGPRSVGSDNLDAARRWIEGGA